MCLRVKDSTPKIAEKDIVCYKVLARRDDKLVTPFFKYVMEPNHRYESQEPFEIGWVTKTTLRLLLSPRFRNTPVVEGGCFHTFKHRIDAKWLGRVMTKTPNFVILKCIIPKGTEYFEGDSEDMTCYASKVLQTLEPVK